MEKQYRQKDLKKLLGIERNRIFQWINVYRILEKPNVGTGGRIKYSTEDIITLSIFRTLLLVGFTVRAAKKMTRFVLNSIEKTNEM